MPLYEHYSHVDALAWRWPNFTPEEIACKGSGELLVDEYALDRLQKLRTLLGRPLRINSGYRSKAYNRKVRGSPKSQHMLGKAFDIALELAPGAAREAEREELVKAGWRAGFTGIGLYDSFVHFDTGPKRRWDERKAK